MKTKKIQILESSNPILRQVAKPIDKINSAIMKLADNMLIALSDHRGIGLAAPQIGNSKRIILINTAWKEKDGIFIFLVNPEIIEKSEEMETKEEGCLSCPDVFKQILRHKKVIVRGMTLHSDIITIEANGLTARVIQHEIAHLDGRLIVG